MFRIWYSTESIADYIIRYSILSKKSPDKRKIYESDANNGKNFHSLPDHIKQILYLDAPDLIVEYNSEPIFSIEISTEAGTGHNAFQRFARLAASVENNVPSFYVYPEAAIISRIGSTTPKWDKINPLIFKALEETMTIYNIPSLLFYFPTDFRTHSDPIASPNKGKKGLKFESGYTFAGCPSHSDPEMEAMFEIINDIVQTVESKGVIEGRASLTSMINIRKRRAFMNSEFTSKKGTMSMSPLSATEIIDTTYLLNHLSKYQSQSYQIGELLRSRSKTVIYKVDASFRGDPYPGALAAIDYLLCREGKTFEDRKYNLVLLWGNMTKDVAKRTINISGRNSKIADFVKDVRQSESKNLLTRKTYSKIKNFEIPRYYMQVRYGSMFSKAKHIRVYAYFADAILFPDGALWRDG